MDHLQYIQIPPNAAKIYKSIGDKENGSNLINMMYSRESRLETYKSLQKKFQKTVTI